MTVPEVPGLAALRRATLGVPEVVIAVLDGWVDLDHPCFAGADLTRMPTPGAGPTTGGPMTAHGTHIASVLFGQPGSPVEGIAPRCRGLLVPVFSDDGPGLSQLDLARAVEQAVHAGAHVVNISGGERTPTTDPQPVLARALQLCVERGVLVVAAVGNDGCECLQVPAAVGSVLAVGGTDGDGSALSSNNWGADYDPHGVIAPGRAVVGASPGGGTATMTGSSFATPVVAGVAALMLSDRFERGEELDPLAVGRAIVAGADPCRPEGSEPCRRFLAGTLRVPVPSQPISTEREPAVSSAPTTIPEPDAGPGTADLEPAAAAAGPDTTSPPGAPPPAGVAAAGPPPEPAPPGAPHATGGPPGMIDPGVRAAGIRAAGGDCACESVAHSYVYAIGSIGFDYGNEARRDGFRQQMPDVELAPVAAPQGDAPGVVFHRSPPNPYDPNQLAAYLEENPWASSKVIWTLNLDRTPIYALEAEPSVGMAWGDVFVDGDGRPTGIDPVRPPVSYVHRALRDAIRGQLLPDDDENYVSRVSIPGVLTDRTVRLYSGQVVPVVVVSARGLYTWNEPALVSTAVAAVETSVREDAERRGVAAATAMMDQDQLRANIRAFLDKVYFQFRNLGQSPPDRALNFAATNAFLFTNEIRQGLLSGLYVPGQNSGLFTLDTITVAKSTYCRMDSDCWDVTVSFFDPENDRRARVSYLFTVDVSDELPVSLAPTHRFLTSG